MMSNIFFCGPSCEDDRPVIDFDDETNSGNDWLAVGEVVDGTLPEKDYPVRVTIRVDDPKATDWHCYMDGGIGGLFSARFIDCVGKNALRYFSQFPAFLNGAEYFFLRCDEPIDCLNRSQSSFDVFPHDPSRIMRITHYSFFDEKIPYEALFCIPEVHRLFATDAIVKKIRCEQLKGVMFSELP